MDSSAPTTQPENTAHVDGVFSAMSFVLGAMAVSLDGPFWAAVTIVALVAGAGFLVAACAQVVRSVRGRRTPAVAPTAPRSDTSDLSPSV